MERKWKTKIVLNYAGYIQGEYDGAVLYKTEIFGIYFKGQFGLRRGVFARKIGYNAAIYREDSFEKGNKTKENKDEITCRTC